MPASFTITHDYARYNPKISAALKRIDSASRYTNTSHTAQERYHPKCLQLRHTALHSLRRAPTVGRLNITANHQRTASRSIRVVIRI
jgi:hypothetical protein